MVEELASHDELTLIRTEGSYGGAIHDADGDFV
jgi:hypothetical protein